MYMHMYNVNDVQSKRTIMDESVCGLMMAHRFHPNDLMKAILASSKELRAARVRKKYGHLVRSESSGAKDAGDTCR